MKKQWFGIYLMMTLLVLIFATVSIAAPSGEYPAINDGKPVTLRVQFWDFTPSLSEKPTPEQPSVFNSSRRLTEEFTRLHPNVTIEWERYTANNYYEAAEWWTTQIAAGTGPDIGFTWGNAYQDRGWYLSLDDILETPNQYVDGNERWRDLFPEYIWNKLTDAKGTIVALPLEVFPGPATAYYYNMEIFEKTGLTIPSDWEDLLEVSKKLKAAGYIPVAPWGGNKSINTDLWDLYFSVGPPYAAPLFEQIDYNDDGYVRTDESLRAVKEGYFDTTKHEYAREVWHRIKEKMTEVYVEGWQNIDFEPVWNEGKVAMLQDGLWRMPSEYGNTKRNFEFGMFPPPIVTKRTSSHVGEIPFTERGPHQPDPKIMFNIFAPSITAHGGQGVQEAAVAFLKFMTVPDNLSLMILEKRGQSLGAVRGTKIPPELESWFRNPFPIFPNVSWPTAFTSDGHEAMSKHLEMWAKDMIDDDTFFQKWNELQQKSADDAIRKQEIDTSGWDI